MELLDDSPVVPGDTRAVFEHSSQARQILNDCEDDLRDWQPEADQFRTPVGSRSPSLKGKNREVLDVEEPIPLENETRSPPSQQQGLSAEVVA